MLLSIYVIVFTLASVASVVGSAQVDALAYTDGTMAVHFPKSLRVEVEIPDEAFAHHPREPQKLASELRVLWFLEQVRQRRLGFEKAAELAGLPAARFLERMRESQITPFDYDPEELASELS